MLCKTTKELVETEYWMPFTFRQLLVWGKVRDFKVDLELEGAEGMPKTSLLLLWPSWGVLPGPCLDLEQEPPGLEQES